MRLPRELYERLVAHARAEAPNECCGMIAASDGAAVATFPITNIHASPLRYEMEPREMYRALTEIDDQGWELGASYHSHTRTEPRPSQTDINLARLWPGTPILIIGLAGGEPDLRVWRIEGDDPVEVPLEIE